MGEENYFEKRAVSIGKAVFPMSWLKRWLKFKLGMGVKKNVVAELVLDGITFAEGPRIHNGFLYFSDMHANTVYKFDTEARKVVDKFKFDDAVSGLGWLPDGTMIVVSMENMKLLTYDETTKETKVHADLSEYCQHRVNDMVVDNAGNAYVGNFGFDFTKLSTSCTTTLVKVDAAGNAKVVSTGMFFPNGSVITPDGKTLIVAETMSSNLTAFDIDETDGSLKNRRVWANVGAPVDGMCLDAEGCIWVAVPQVGAYDTNGAFIRVAEGGEIKECIGLGRNGLQGKSIACTLATHSNGKHYLYLLEAITSAEKPIKAKYKEKNSRIKILEVPVGPAKHADCEQYNAGYC